MADEPIDAGLDDALFLVDVEDPVGGGTTRTLSHSRSSLVLIGMATNRYVRGSSRLFQKRFGIGVMDWRMLVMLTRQPDISVTAASRTIGVDKAAVSRALARLEKTGLAEAACPGGNRRHRVWRLSHAGRAKHDEMLAISLRIHQAILSEFSRDEIEAFNGFLRRFIASAEDLKDLPD